MTVNFQDDDIKAVWSEIFSKDYYRMMISDIADNYPQKKSVLVNYSDINACNINFAMYVLDNPDKCLRVAKKTAMSLVPNINHHTDEINIRIYNLPRDAKVEIRNLRAYHLRRLIAVEGLARKATTVKPRMVNSLFRCARCNSEIWIEQPGMILREPIMCSNSDGGCNK